MVRIAIVDDDHESVRKLHGYVNAFYRGAESEYAVTEFSDGEDLLRGYVGIFDIIFLDIEMERSNGIKVARAIRKKDTNAVIIFISQMTKYAVEGYDVNALDYVVKPVDYYSFEIKMRKAINYLETHRSGRIQLNMDGDYVWLFSDEIKYIEVFNHELVYHTLKGEYRVNGSMAAAADQLKGYNFRQCSRYCIVNLKYVTGLRDHDLCVEGTVIQVSKRRRKEMVEALLDYFGGKA